MQGLRPAGRREHGYLAREEVLVRKTRADAEAEGEQSRTFESALARLEEIIAQLESADVPLARAIALVQEGDELARFCEQQLRAAEGKVMQLVERLGGVELESVEVETGEDAEDED